MKKITIIVIISILLISVSFLCGCNEQTNNNVEKDLPIINSFTVNPGSINEGDTSKLKWDVSNAEFVSLDISKYGTQYTDLIWEIDVNPIITTTYTLTATKGDEETTATVQIIVEEHEDAEKFIGSWFGSYTSVDETTNTTYTFLSDRTLKYSSLWISPTYGKNYDNKTGTWQFIDDKLVLKISGQTSTNDYTFSNNNNDLTIAFSSGITVDFTKQ
jgi:hypothetical protein